MFDKILWLRTYKNFSYTIVTTITQIANLCRANVSPQTTTTWADVGNLCRPKGSIFGRPMTTVNRFEFTAA